MKINVDSKWLKLELNLDGVLVLLAIVAVFITVVAAVLEIL